MSARRLRLGLLCAAAAAWLVVVQVGTAGAHRRPASRARLSQTCAGADVPVAGAPATTMRAAVLCLINQERSDRGLPGLHASARLNVVAQRQTQTMVATGFFGHGPNFTLRFSAAGYNWRAAGENIASGFATPRSVVNAWMASLGHCRNILDPSFRDTGTGVTAAPVGADVGAGTWTEEFGLLMSQSAPSGNTGPQAGCPY